MGEWGNSRQGGKWVVLMVIGLLLIMMAIMGTIVMSAMSDFARDFVGGVMILLPAVEACVGVILIASGIISRRKEMEEKIRREAVIAQQIERQRQMIELERQKLVNDLKATIRVRCRYCGILNEENEEKCESCGAPL